MSKSEQMVAFQGYSLQQEALKQCLTITSSMLNVIDNEDIVKEIEDWKKMVTRLNDLCEVNKKIYK